MAEQVYDAKTYALELGFSEEDAERFGKQDYDATKLRLLAKSRGVKKLMPDQLAAKAEGEGKSGMHPLDVKALAKINAEKAAEATARALEERLAAKPKVHKHYYRKDGTCACGAVRKVK